MTINPQHTPSAPPAVGSYSPAVKAGEFIFLSGVIGKNPATDTLVDGIENQTRQVLTNIEAVLSDCGAKITDIAKTTIFLVNMDDYALVNKLYADAMGDHRPARSTVQVAALPAGALIEIEVIARIAD